MTLGQIISQAQNKLRSLEQAFAAERAARTSAEAAAKAEYERTCFFRLLERCPLMSICGRVPKLSCQFAVPCLLLYLRTAARTILAPALTVTLLAI